MSKNVQNEEASMHVATTVHQTSSVGHHVAAQRALAGVIPRKNWQVKQNKRMKRMPNKSKAVSCSSKKYFKNLPRVFCRKRGFTENLY